MRHFKSSFKGEKPLHEIHAAVGHDGGLVTRVHVEKGETTVYFSAAEAKGKHLKEALGAGEPSEVREDEVTRLG